MNAYLRRPLLREDVETYDKPCAYPGCRFVGAPAWTLRLCTHHGQACAKFVNASKEEAGAWPETKPEFEADWEAACKRAASWLATAIEGHRPSKASPP